MPDPFPQLREKYSSPRIETFQCMELVSLLLCIALHSVEKSLEMSHSLKVTFASPSNVSNL